MIEGTNRLDREDICEKVTNELLLTEKDLADIDKSGETQLSREQEQCIKMFMYYLTLWQQGPFVLERAEKRNRIHCSEKKGQKYKGETDYEIENEKLKLCCMYPFEYPVIRGTGASHKLGCPVYIGMIVNIIANNEGVKQVLSARYNTKTYKEDDLTEDAERVWKRFVELGLATKGKTVYESVDLSFLTPERAQKMVEISEQKAVNTQSKIVQNLQES